MLHSILDEVTKNKEFTEQASDDGDQIAASRFTELRSNEIVHHDAFKADLNKLNKVKRGEK